jgi:hypothetical protein
MSISAMKQALEALEKVVKWHSVRDKNDLPLKPINQPPEIKESIDASAALRQAIAEAEEAAEKSLRGIPKSVLLF